MSESLDPPAAALPPPESGSADVSPLGVQGDAGGTSDADVGPPPEDSTSPPPFDTTSSPDTPPSLTADSYQFTIPEGVTLDEASLGTLKETLAASGVPPESAQSLVDMHIAQMGRNAEAINAANQAAWTVVTEGWKRELLADPAFGGAKMAEVQTRLGRVFDEYGSPEARQAFDLTGVGWNPAIVRMIDKMALALSEGTPHSASGPSQDWKGKTPAAILFPSTPNS